MEKQNGVTNGVFWGEGMEFEVMGLCIATMGFDCE